MITGGGGITTLSITSSIMTGGGGGLTTLSITGSTSLGGSTNLIGSTTLGGSAIQIGSTTLSITGAVKTFYSTIGIGLSKTGTGHSSTGLRTGLSNLSTTGALTSIGISVGLGATQIGISFQTGFIHGAGAPSLVELTTLVFPVYPNAGVRTTKSY